MATLPATRQAAAATIKSYAPSSEAADVAMPPLPNAVNVKVVSSSPTLSSSPRPLLPDNVVGAASAHHPVPLLPLSHLTIGTKERERDRKDDEDEPLSLG